MGIDVNGLHSEMMSAQTEGMKDVQDILGSCLIKELNINRPDDWRDFDFTSSVRGYIDGHPPTQEGGTIKCSASVIPGSEEHVLHRAAVEEWGNDESNGNGPMSKPGAQVWGHHLDSKHISTAKHAHPIKKYLKVGHPVLENSLANAKSYDQVSILENRLLSVDFGSFIKFH